MTALYNYDCDKDDMLEGDEIKFREGVYRGYPPEYLGSRIIYGQILKISYSEKKKSNVYKILIHKCKGCISGEHIPGESLSRSAKSLFKERARRQQREGEVLGA